VKKTIKKCENCQQEYEARRERQRFCGKTCQYEFIKKPIVPRILVSCCICKKDLERKINSVKKNAYCSDCFKIQRIGTKLTEEHKQKISETRLRDWAKGDVYKNVRTGPNGRTVKWYEHKKPNGDVVRLQGTWELLYAKYLDEKNINYVAHRGAIWYTKSLDGTRRVYLPDFYLTDFDEYIDIKNDYVLNLDESKKKFEDIKSCNPQLKITIITKRDLITLNLLKR